MVIYIKTLTGKRICIEASYGSTIYQVKELICDKEGIPVDQQRLERQQGMGPLRDLFTFVDYNIHDGSEIELILCLRGVPNIPLQLSLPIPCGNAVKTIKIENINGKRVSAVKQAIQTSHTVLSEHQIIKYQGKKLSDDEYMLSCYEQSEISFEVSRININVNFPLVGPMVINIPAYADIASVKQEIANWLDNVHPNTFELYIADLKLKSDETTYTLGIVGRATITLKITTREKQLEKEIDDHQKRFNELQTRCEEDKKEISNLECKRKKLHQKLTRLEDEAPSRLYMLKTRDLTPEKLESTLDKCQAKLAKLRHDRNRLEEMVDSINREKLRRNKNECVICFSGPPRIVFDPCGHVVTCEACSDGILQRSNKCPICRKRIDKAIKTFLL